LQGDGSTLILDVVLISIQTGLESTIEEWLMKKYEGVIYKVARERKEDLKMVFTSKRLLFYNG
jgi:hypothetical protein